MNRNILNKLGSFKKQGMYGNVYFSFKVTPSWKQRKCLNQQWISHWWYGHAIDHFM